MISTGNLFGYQQVGSVGVGAPADAKAKNAPLAGTKGVDNNGIAIDGQKAGAVVRISRRVQPATEAAPGMDANPSDDTLRAMAAKQVDFYVHSMNAAEKQAATHIEPWNEPRPNTDAGYRALAKLMMFTCDACDANGFKAILMSLNCGTPEWSQIRAALQTQVGGESFMRRAIRSNARIGVHEGLLGGYPDVLDATIFGCMIPGSPFLGTAHPLVMRWLFWRLAAQQLGEPLAPFDVTEFYPAVKVVNKYAIPELVKRLSFYESLMSLYPEAGIVYPYGVGNTGVGLPANNLATIWPGLVQYCVSVKDRVNGHGVTPIPAPIPTPVPTPVPTPIPAPQLSVSAVGLHWRADGRGQQADFNAASAAKIEAVKLMSTASSDDISRLHSLNPEVLLVTRLFADLRNRVATPDDFISWVIGDLKVHWNAGVRKFEVHNEPNLAEEGNTISWNGGAGFGTWFMDVCSKLRQEFPGIQLGWPGLSPGFDVPGVRENDAQFLAEAGHAAATASDWIGEHTYWQSDQEMLAIPQQIAAYRSWGGGKPIVVTEFADVSAATKDVKGQGYVRYYNMLKTLPGVEAAFAFVVSSSQGFLDQTWRDESGNLSPIPAIVGARPEFSPVGHYRVTANVLNVRSFPWVDVEPPIVGHLVGGMVVTVYQIFKTPSMLSGWGAISQDATKWVSMQYLAAA